MNLVNWTNQLAMHQSSLMRAMAEMGWHVTMVVAEPISPGRTATGWMVPDYSKTEVIVDPNSETIDTLVKKDIGNTVHLFGGASAYRWGRYAIGRAAQLKCQMGLMSEAGDPYGWKGPLRWGKHVLNNLMFGRNFQFVLAMGTTGICWFRACGYPSHKLYPFGYFVEIIEGRSKQQSSATNIFEILFVGRLVELKRVDLLLRSVRSLYSQNIRLSIIGDGPERKNLQILAEELGILDLVQWCGVLPQEDVRRHMSNASLLVLPSRYDGWGAVVNEALMAGTPVICTSSCGASDLITEHWRGTVVPPNSQKALSAAINHRIQLGALSNNDRERIQRWSKCITGTSGAEYLHKIIAHIYWGDEKRPSAPWIDSV